MKLWWRAGEGSALIEAQAAEYGLELEMIGLDDPDHGAHARVEWEALSPLKQFPTMQLDDGQVMTESAAITLWLADHLGSDLLVPHRDAPDYPLFLRWLIWLAATVRPCVSFGMMANTLVADPIEARGLHEHLMERMDLLWLHAAEEADSPWFLGERFSAIDIFLAVMLHWGRGLNWSAEHAPRLYNIAAATMARPAMASVLARNFPDDL